VSIHQDQVNLVQKLQDRIQHDTSLKMGVTWVEETDEVILTGHTNGGLSYYSLLGVVVKTLIAFDSTEPANKTVRNLILYTPLGADHDQIYVPGLVGADLMYSVVCKMEGSLFTVRLAVMHAANHVAHVEDLLNKRMPGSIRASQLITLGDLEVNDVFYFHDDPKKTPLRVLATRVGERGDYTHIGKEDATDQKGFKRLSVRTVIKIG
jgi:hypothetical protein